MILSSITSRASSDLEYGSNLKWEDYGLKTYLKVKVTGQRTTPAACCYSNCWWVKSKIESRKSSKYTPLSNRRTKITQRHSLQICQCTPLVSLKIATWKKETIIAAITSVSWCARAIQWYNERWKRFRFLLFACDGSLKSIEAGASSKIKHGRSAWIPDGASFITEEFQEWMERGQMEWFVQISYAFLKFIKVVALEGQCIAPKYHRLYAQFRLSEQTKERI